jgi:hypothetical protein
VTAVLAFSSVFFISTGNSLNFVFDSSGGGRASEASLRGVQWLPSGPVPAFNEVIYGSAAQDYGVLGLLAFLLIFAGPPLLLLVDRTALRSPARRAALEGLMLYAFLGLSDGALDFIPVMAFYWFAYMIFVFGWPNSASAVLPARRPATAPVRTSSTVLGDLTA